MRRRGLLCPRRPAPGAGPVTPVNSACRRPYRSVPGVFAVWDVTSVGTPKAGVFCERQAAAAARASEMLATDKTVFGTSRIRRWFGREWPSVPGPAR
jgi:hypothetical protein